MTVRYVGLTSTFDEQRLAINGIAQDVDNLLNAGYATTTYVGLATAGLASVSYVNNQVAISTLGLLSSVGNGSLLTGIVTSIVAGTNITISGSNGQVTINSPDGGVFSQWVTATVGIHTLSNVGIGTTNPKSKLDVVGDVNVSGVVTATSYYGSGANLTNLNIPSSFNELDAALFS